MRYVFALFIAYALFSCTTFVPTEIVNGKLMGVVPMQYGRGSYQVTVPVRADREQVFRQARRWAAFHVPNAANALSLSDNQIGDVLTAGVFDAAVIKAKGGSFIFPKVGYAASVECGENYYRVTLTNFTYMVYEKPINGIETRSTGFSVKTSRRRLEEIDRKVNQLLANMQEFVTSEIKPTE